MFCQKCGSKTIDGAEFCQKCGAKLVKPEPETQQPAETDPVPEPVQPKTPVTAPSPAPKVISPVQTTEEKPAKKKSKKLPLLIVVLVVLVLFIVCIIASYSSDESPETNKLDAKTSADEINLDQTFNDMGISFNYPETWTALDDGSEYTIISLLDSNNTADHRITFKVSMILDDDPMNVFSGDEAAVREAVNLNATYMEYKDAVLGEYPVKYLKYQADGLKSADISENYFYRIGAEGYRINCTYTASDEKTYHPLFDKIIAGCTVNSENVNSVAFNEDDIIRSAYCEKILELAAKDNDMTFDLIDLTADNVYELVAGKTGYYVNIYAYDNGNVVPIIEDWGYGAGGNHGYSYLPGKNIIQNDSFLGAGAEMYTTYMCVDSNHKMQYVYGDDLGYIYPSSYYLGQREISEFEYESYQIYGEYAFIEGTLTADEIIMQLSNGAEVRSSTDGEITFNDVSVSSFINMPIYSITYWWGEPVEYNQGGGLNYCKYDGIYFEFDFSGKIYSISVAPEMCLVNGQTLNKNRDGIAAILGSPTHEGWSEDGYNIYYDYPSDGYSAHFYLTSQDEQSDALRFSLIN